MPALFSCRGQKRPRHRVGLRNSIDGEVRVLFNSAMSGGDTTKRGRRSLQKCGRMIAPDGTAYEAVNLTRFVQTHAHLFAEEDVQWMSRDGGGQYCKAVAGFSNLRRGKARTWKGWWMEGGRPPLRRIRWTSLDWSKSTSEISRELGVSAVTVSIARRKHAPDTVQSQRARIREEQWQAVDWSKTSTEIAHDLGCSLSSVSHARRRHEDQ